ncbi:MAG TPA: hypothetical protein VFF25_05635 [Clostridia bacterium]|nr:hypothetical protein [Clostridia bacterium]
MTFYYFEQDITAYTAKQGAIMASGVTPEVGYVAVHPARWGMEQWNNPIIPFGASITLLDTEESIFHPIYGELRSFQVQDVGDMLNSRGLSRYFLDIYWGEGPDMEQSAINFGIQKRSFRVTIST